MECPNCGKEIRDEEAIYCPQCGLNLEETMITGEEASKKKKTKVMKKLSGVDKEELLSRGISREKIALIREDLHEEFLEGNLERLPLLLKDCVFQTYSEELGEEEPRKGVLCGLLDEKRRCLKNICPLYQSWKKKM